MPHAALTATATASVTAPADPAAALPPPPTATKPRGNPNLALAPAQPARGLDPQGARTRAGCPCRSPAIHGKLRCRMHGPRTPEGRIRVREARTIHGNYGAKARADNRFRITLLRVTRVDIALDLYQAHLPPAFAAGLCRHPPELLPPPRPNGGITAAQDRAMRHAVAASLAPWRAAIAEARAAHRAVRDAAAARAATAQIKPNAPARPRRRRAPPASPLETLFARLAANRHAPDRTADGSGGIPHATPSPRLPGPHAPERATAPPAVASLGLPAPHAPERACDAHTAARHAPSGHAPSLGVSEPLAPVNPRSPTPPLPTIASLLAELAANLQALDRAADAPSAAAAPPVVPSRGRSETRRPEPHAPVAARTPRAEPLAPDPASPAPPAAVPSRDRSETRRSEPHAPVAARLPGAEPLAPDPASPAPAAAAPPTVPSRGRSETR